MDICECMCKQDENGNSVCNLCHSDIYACECSLVHTHTCDAGRLTEDILIIEHPSWCVCQRVCGGGQ